MMTRKQQTKLAGVCREVAADRTIKFGFSRYFHNNGDPCCAIGHVMYRSGPLMDGRFTTPWGMVIYINDKRSKNRPRLIRQALIKLAEALEAG